MIKELFIGVVPQLLATSPVQLSNNLVIGIQKKISIEFLIFSSKSICQLDQGQGARSYGTER